ncbi:MAG TPA: YceI family protein [Myxococcaceae bacterium]|nr:YceI family protein [Myxococcaceae bacterium]
MGLFAVTAAVVLAFSPATHAATWDIDAGHSQVGFSIRHLMVSNVKGEFAKVTGTLTLDEKDVTQSSAQAVIDAASINTRDPKRDEHLRSPDFFDVAKYPTITFKSKSVRKAGDKLKIVGDLTMHGVTREVTLDATAPTREVVFNGLTKTGLTATTQINRKDFGISWNKALDNGGIALGEEVAIALELEFDKKVSPTAQK